MRKNFFKAGLCIFSLVALFSFVDFYADQNWAGVVTDATNENVTISASSTITGARTVTVSDGNTYTVTPSGNFNLSGDGAGNARLFLVVTNGTLQFDLSQYNLTFKGSPAAALVPQDLFIGIRGGGTVEFLLGNDKKVSFTQNGTGGGVKFYVLMDDTPNIGNVSFKRADNNSSSNVTIEIGPRSLIGFLSYTRLYDALTALLDEAIITFDPTNLYNPTTTGEGRMILDIAPTGGMIISGRWLDTDTDPTLANVHPEVPAGCKARVQIVNTNDPKNVANASLLVLNKNTEGFEYLADPWGDLGTRSALDGIGSFSGIQYGFVLGNNGVLDVGTFSYLDYVGLANDLCPTFTYDLVPTPTCACQGCGCDCGGNIAKFRNPSAFVVDGYNDDSDYINNAFIKLGAHSAIVYRSGINCCGTVENDINSAHPFVVSCEYMSPDQGQIVFDVEGCLTVSGTVSNGESAPSKLEILSQEVKSTGGPVLYDGSETTFPALICPTRQSSVEYYNKACFFINNTMNLCHTWLVHTDKNHTVIEKNDTQSEPTYVGGETFRIFEGTPRPRIVYYNSQLYVHENIAFTGVDQLIPNGYLCREPSCLLECGPGQVRVECPCCLCEFCYTTPIATLFRTAKGLKSLKGGCDCNCGAIPCTCICSTSMCGPQPGLYCDDNISKFVFFQNGFCLDEGTGRQMILGTSVGSLSCDCCVTVDNSSHLDVMQCSELPNGAQSCSTKLHQLSLETKPNNGKVNCDLLGKTIGDTEYGVQTIYLGHASNISIGTHYCCDDTPTFSTNHTDPLFYIDGNFFSFETRGGSTGSPATTDVTGQGGIFVDYYGTIDINPLRRANISTMVTKSGDGEIKLPKSQVFFDSRVGVAQWQLNLVNDLCNDTEIIPEGSRISDYTLNWISVKKDFCNGFWPYTVKNFDLCGDCVVTTSNLLHLPSIKGTVEQLQIKESRLGDPAHVKIDGGWVQELVFLSGYNSAEAPVGVMILKNSGRLGIGSLHRNVDSLEASVVLGINGVTIIADGDGRVDLNEDVIVNNVCHILRGPNFTTDNRLVISSDEERMILVRTGGTLDLSTFTAGYTVEVTGNVHIVLEPGAKLIFGGGTYVVSEYAQIICSPLTQSRIAILDNANLTDLDPVRVKIGGTGTVLLEDQAKVVINNGAFAGIEAIVCIDGYGTVSAKTTDLTWIFNDDAKLLIGDGTYGGSLQVGNSSDLNELYDASVTFSVLIDGPDAGILINQQGFLGLGVGMVAKQSPYANDWYVAQTYNLASFSLSLENGIFAHNRIYAGDELDGEGRAHLLAIGSSRNNAIFNWRLKRIDELTAYNISRSTQQGGGNLVLITSTEDAINPVVLNADGTTSYGSAGILRSKPLFRNESNTDTTASGLFDFLKTREAFNPGPSQPFARADLGPGKRNRVRIGYINNGSINRVSWTEIIGQGGITVAQEHSLEIGACGISLIGGVLDSVYELN